jgi:transposase
MNKYKFWQDILVTNWESDDTFKEKLKYLCEFYGIRYVEQEESYTSKSSFLGNDPLPVINLDSPKDYTFTGKRIKRGLYRAGDGRLINSDVNGAGNILRKCKLVEKKVISDLQCNGFLDNPLRLRIN